MFIQRARYTQRMKPSRRERNCVNERGKIVGTIPLEFDGVLHHPAGALSYNI